MTRHHSYAPNLTRYFLKCSPKISKKHTNNCTTTNRRPFNFIPGKKLILKRHQTSWNNIPVLWQSWRAVQLLSTRWCQRAPAASNTPSPDFHTLSVHSQIHGRQSGSIHCSAPLLVLSTALNQSHSTQSCSGWRSYTWACWGLLAQRPLRWVDCIDADHFDLQMSSHKSVMDRQTDLPRPMPHFIATIQDYYSTQVWFSENT